MSRMRPRAARSIPKLVRQVSTDLMDSSGVDRMLGLRVRALLGFIGRFCRWLIFWRKRMPASAVVGMGIEMAFGGLDLVVGDESGVAVGGGWWR